MEPNLRAGLAIYNAGDFHAAHDAWEEYWLGLERDTDDEQFLHGLIQFTAAVHHASERNWAGATGLADSAAAYLVDLGEQYRGVDLTAVRSFLGALGDDPEVIERGGPPALTHDGAVVELAELSFEAAAVAAEVYAEDRHYDESVVEQAIRYAETDVDAGQETSEFVTFVLDFARDAAHRGIVYQRLAEHVQRREQREADVDGLFE
ncbi:DUF309 domain-containing protein [Halorientalis brevis]|uniref:DUF309 domain-containing protein n=1 Tax=Halorientalis brevis TaxID=1126241 RepID=A0ABD6CCY4_9EURY|nr:DUF309 domain-containing protein [Halorientalis brevis]